MEEYRGPALNETPEFLVHAQSDRTGTIKKNSLVNLQEKQHGIVAAVITWENSGFSPKKFMDRFQFV